MKRTRHTSYVLHERSDNMVPVHWHAPLDSDEPWPDVTPMGERWTLPILQGVFLRTRKWTTFQHTSLPRATVSCKVDVPGDSLRHGEHQRNRTFGSADCSHAHAISVITRCRKRCACPLDHFSWLGRRCYSTVTATFIMGGISSSCRVRGLLHPVQHTHGLFESLGSEV